MPRTHRPASHLVAVAASAACATVFLASCSSTGAAADAPGIPTSTATGAVPSGSGGAAWSYAGDTGPSDWADLSPDYVTCGVGREQSPVDITAPVVSPAALPVLHFSSGPAEVEDNGHTVEAMPDQSDSYIVLADATYGLKNVHFHSPSEHAVNGQSFPLELHFVTKTSYGATAVLGVLVQEGAPDPAWQPFISAMAATAGEHAVQTDLPWSAMVPATFTNFTYAGSLTTPPCTQPVDWLVLDRPITMSPEQVAAFTARYSGNNRPRQPLNGRVISVSAGQ